MTRIVVSKFGAVDDCHIRGVVEAMDECYRRLEPHSVEIVDLQVFERSSQMEAFLSQEYLRVGVLSERFDETFLVMHDAWRGTPRITVSLDRMNKLSDTLRMAAIRHEVGHSVLHGEISYYILSMPEPLSQAMSDFKLERRYAVDLLYLISIAVKDFEVSRLLYSRGYVQDQVEYVRHLLETTGDEVASWKVAEGRPYLEVLHLVSSLKAPFCAAPFFMDMKFGEEVKESLIMDLEYLSEEGSTILQVVSEMLEQLRGDTVENIAYVSKLVVKHIVAPHLIDASI